MSWENMCLPKERGGMGFRDLQSFNLALLAKQGWRLQTNTSSLFYKVYKAKYFPGCDFVEANMGNQPSYAWRTIMAAQSLVRRGMRWQVGNGERIHIWRDRWVPCPSTYKIITPEKQLPQGQWVKNLLKRDSNEWDVPLVRQTFLSQDADAILSIPLSASGAQDRMVWSENKSGKFTIRSAYRLAQLDRGGEGRAECSNPTSVKRIWRGVWSMDLLNKVKHFAWKACKNILATKENLWKRKITRDGVCEGYKKEIESTGHLFWTCQKAKEV